jgi:hypothetical protein
MAIETQKSVNSNDVSVEMLFPRDTQTVYNICKACTGLDTCTYPVDLNKPTLHCAELKPFPPRPTNGFEKSDSQILKTPGIDVKSDYTGLCRNCDLKNDCTFSGAGKSILHCDEYK